MSPRRYLLALWSGLLGVVLVSSLPAEEPTQEQAVTALRSAVNFYREHCSPGGGYVYRVSRDFKQWEGEAVVTSTRAWIEPPATPGVGLAYLEAWRLTRDPLLMEAALSTADALIRGQLVSGGWGEFIEFDPELRRGQAYRVDHDGKKIGAKVRNWTTFDDNKSQSCTKFLIRLDQALEFRNQRVHEAAEFALSSFLKAQYPNGAWPQGYSEFPDPTQFPVKKATFPETWPREFPRVRYQSFYTLNDNTQRDLLELMFEAHDIYGKPEYRQAAIRNADFLLLAQLPEPQPGWAQQYDHDMHPVWARRFEPASITGGESQGVMEALMLTYRRTGDPKYLAPFPRVLDYYDSLVLPDGQLARFYEIGTNRPLYFTTSYELTYSDSSMPTHYSFKVRSNLQRIRTRYNEISALPPNRLWQPSKPSVPKMSDSLRRDARRAIDTLDERGAWLEGDWMTSKTFIKNLGTLSRYLAASR